MKANSPILLFGFALISLQAVYAQDIATKPLLANIPIVLEPIVGKPQLKVLKIEDEPNSHYERWVEATLVVFGNVLPSADNIVYTTRSLKNIDFDLRLQANGKKSDITTWNQFCRQLESVKPDPQTWYSEPNGMLHTEKPLVRGWDSVQWSGEGITTTPIATLESSSKSGEVCYAWLIRTFEMKSKRIGKKVVLQATIHSATGGITYTPLEFGNTFDNTIGQILDKTGKPVGWQTSLLKSESF